MCCEQLLTYLFSNKDDILCHIQHYKNKNKKAMLSILSFEMKRPLSHEDKWKWSMFDYFQKTNLSGLILLCIVFRQRWSQQKTWLTPSWQLLFISKSYLYFRVISSLIVPGRSAASAGLGKWECPQFCKLLNVHCSDCAFVFACSNCWIK